MNADDNWEVPVATPSAGTGSTGKEILPHWDEDNVRWIGTSVIDDDTVANFVWNPSTSAWEAA